jgi:hypothetical protein
MSKKVSFFIEQLDMGFTITEDGKKRALENEQNVEQHLMGRFLREIEKFSHSGVSNMTISIEVIENSPKLA